VGSWYWIGVLAGLGTAIGVAFTAALNRVVPSAVVSIVVAAVIGYLTLGWPEAVGGAVGAVCGAVGAGPLVAGALRRGGTRGATATLVGIAALLGAGLAFVPVVGYLEALAVLVLGLRLRRRSPDRHAGLRTLARD
jgi:hypothetical protein